VNVNIAQKSLRGLAFYCSKSLKFFFLIFKVTFRNVSYTAIVDFVPVPSYLFRIFPHASLLGVSRILAAAGHAAVPRRSKRGPPSTVGKASWSQEVGQDLSSGIAFVYPYLFIFTPRSCCSGAHPCPPSRKRPRPVRGAPSPLYGRREETTFSPMAKAITKSSLYPFCGLWFVVFPNETSSSE